MTIHFSSIVLDGMPWISFHYPIFRRLTFPWTWSIMEGVAENTKCTSWCKKIPPRLSNDGTTQYLESLRFDPRIKLYQKPLWHGKHEMVNAPLGNIKEDCLLWQVDSDEIWTVEQIEKVRRLFLQHPARNQAFFYCRYFVGPDIVTVGNDSYGNNPDEWLRVWRFKPGMKFLSHEPPKLTIASPRSFTRDETHREGLVFDHYAYATEKQLALKQQYYGGNSGLYVNAVEDWKRLQKATIFPCKLRSYLPWVDGKAEAVRI